MRWRIPKTNKFFSNGRNLKYQVLHEQQKLQNKAFLLPSNQTCNINQLNSTHLSEKLIIFESIDVIFS
jgi:hypothetical protein